MVRETGVVTFVVGIPFSCDSYAFILSRCKTYGSFLESPRPVQIPTLPGKDFADQETSLPIRKRVCRPGNEFADQETSLPTRKRVCRPGNDFADQERALLIRKGLC